jgi:hypothetical protein
MMEERRGHSSSIASRSSQLFVRGEGPTCPHDTTGTVHNELPPRAAAWCARRRVGWSKRTNDYDSQGATACSVTWCDPCCWSSLGLLSFGSSWAASSKEGGVTISGASCQRPCSLPSPPHFRRPRRSPVPRAVGPRPRHASVVVKRCSTKNYVRPVWEGARASDARLGQL